MTNGSRAPRRVVVWATGAVGKTVLRGALNRADLMVVGVYTYSSRKVGMDAGSIAGSDPIGVLATSDKESIYALDADIVLHMPRIQVPYEAQDEDLCNLLKSGKNVITTVGHHYPRYPNPKRYEEFLTATQSGNSTLYGVGINPGFLLERLVATLSSVSYELDSIEITEMLDASTMPEPGFVFDIMGMGSDPSKVDITTGPLAELYGRLYGEAITYLADQLGVALDNIQPDHAVYLAESDLKVRSGLIKQGTVAATEWRWYAVAGDLRVISLTIAWTMDPKMDRYLGAPHWRVKLHGSPNLDLKLDMSDPAKSSRKTKAGQYITAGPVLNAINAVIDAPSGVLEPRVFAPYNFDQTHQTT